jgi:peptide/nickel transport system permease protein
VAGYLIRRLLLAILTLLIISAVVYAAVRVLPGGPTWGEDPVNRPQVEAWMRTHHIDEPILIGYARWLGTVLRFDLGTSLSVRPGSPVTTVVADALPYTLLLGSLGFILTMVTAIPLGMLSAWRPDSAVARTGSALLYLLHALPTFWIALVLQQTIAGHLSLLPLLGPGPVGGGTGESRASFLASVPYWVLPTLAMTLGSMAFVIFLSRTTLLDAARGTIARAARARGAGDRRVLLVHGLASAAVPLVSLAALMLPGIVAGSIMIETIFALPGLGRLFFLAASRRDYPLVMALALLSATATVLVNLAADLVYRALDPRVLEEIDGEPSG